MDTDALEEALNGLSAEGKQAKLLYVVPSFQNPTSTVLSQGRRRRMLELAEEHDLLIVEDNPYGYISFDGPMPTPLKAMDDGGRVLYTSTFSKIVSPGLRIGWLAAREDFVEKMTEAKNNVNISNDGLSTYVATEFLNRGLVERQIPKMTQVYREKRDTLLEAMVDSFPEEARWNDPKGGLFLWVEMPGHVDTTGMMMDAVRRGVAYVPGSNFFVDTSIRNYIRLNYSFPSLDDIREGIGILGGLLRENV
jgi:2-aminoadipate transaminase